MRLRATLGTKLAIIFGILCLLVAIFQNGYVILKMRNDLYHSVQSNSNYLLSFGAAQLSTYYGLHEKRIMGYTNADLTQLKELESDLNVLFKSSNFMTAYIAASDASFYSAPKIELPPTYTPVVRPWFTSVKNVGDLVFSDVYKDAFTGKMVLTLSRYMQNDAQNRKVVIAGDLFLTTKALEKLFHDVTTESSYMVLVGKDGTILFSPYQEELLKPIQDIVPDLTQEQINKYSSESYELEPYKIKDYDGFVSTDIIDKTGFSMVMLTNKAIVFDDYYTHTWGIILFAFFETVIGLGIMVILIYRMLKTLRDVNIAIKDLAEGEGDLTISVQVDSSDEIAKLAHEVNLFIRKLHKIISEVVSLGNQISDHSMSFNNMAKKTQSQLSSQQSEVTQIAAAVHQMSATAQEVASNAERTATATVDSAKHCEQGKEVVQKNKESITKLADQVRHTSDVISELESNTQNITTILSTIQDIAKQTNLLALNAAIEAARAGDQGRGFAVVADEVRVLSQRTHGSTEEIKTMIDSLLVNTDSAVKTMEQSLGLANGSVEEANNATKALNEISRSIEQISDMSTQIASAAEEQRAVTDEVSRNIQSVSQFSDQMVQAAGEFVRMSESLRSVAGDLGDTVGKFKV